MSYTVTPCLLAKRKKQNGLIPVFIRLTKNGQSVYLKLDFDVPEVGWNAKKKRVRDSVSQSKRYNQIIEDQVLFWVKKLADIPSSERFSIAEMKAIVLSEAEGTTLEKQMEAYLEQLELDEREDELDKAKTLLRNLKTYSEQRERIKEARDIDVRISADFQRYLKGMRLKNNTIRRKMGTFTAFMEFLRLRGQVNTNPVLEVKKVPEEPTSKTKLTVAQIESIIQLDLEPGSKLWHTRNYFLYSYYNGGIRFGDVCRLRWSDIKNGRLIYRMSKTGEEISFKQDKVHLDILQHYKAGSDGKTERIFPLLSGRSTSTKKEEKRAINSLNGTTNTNLRRLARMAGVEEKISFHVSRHSFADYARISNIDLHTISKLLRHTKLSTTERYLSGFDEVAADQAISKLFGDRE